MKLLFSVVAEKEVQDAADYYESQEAGLGLRFLNELDRATSFILQFPQAWTPISKRGRRCCLRYFPYSVIYSVQADTITIITVVNQSRDPEKWQTLIRDLHR
ncbi:MAG TPA: type II toxin-antitoxin system RelE/ParE family toxin [Pyrinomonadaceae bacterium]|nr:type II toxin-antitoxin system RelE/ParE family toxin [Pyrinomonadaceae bacterium]